MNIVMGLAIYFILWWLAFFAVLPIGAHSLHEGDEAAVAGVERGAPKTPNLGFKALLAAGIAALLWLGVFWAVSVDLFKMRG
jgi:predicted secreted protein